MKRLFPLALCLILVAFAFPLSVSAAETVASGSAGEHINWVFTDDGTLTLSGYGEMENNGNLANAEKDFGYYPYRTRIKSIVIEEGITSISPYAFYNYGGYCTSVSLPDSLLSIGRAAFSGAIKNVSSIRLPSQLQTIGDYAFRYSASLVSVTIPASVVDLGSLSFADCDKLVSVVCLSETPPEAWEAFQNYKVLTRIMVPGGSVPAYQSAQGWSVYAGFIQDGLPDPNPFDVYESWADQYIYIDSGETVNLYFIADGVNGTVTVDWYANGQLIASFPCNNWLDEDIVVSAHDYTPSADGSRTVYAVIKNTIGSKTTSVTTRPCTIVVGQGDGVGSMDSDRFDRIDVELTTIQDAIADVDGKLDDILHGGEGREEVDDFNNTVGDQKDDFDNSMDILEDFTRPDYDDIDPGFDDILDGDPINKITEFFSEIFGNEYINKVFFIAFLLAAISFIVFGKR